VCYGVREQIARTTSGSFTKDQNVHTTYRPIPAMSDLAKITIPLSASFATGNAHERPRVAFTDLSLVGRLHPLSPAGGGA